MQGARRLKPRQQQVLAFFNESLGATGAPPTIRQVMAHCGLKSPRGAELQLRALAAQGYLSHEPHRRPAYRPKYLPTGSTVPIMGRAPAGHPTDQPEDYRGQLHLPWRVGERAFAVSAQGDSMVGAHLLDGDIVVVDPDHEFRPGAIVLAILSGEYTIKRWVRQGDGWALEAENPAYPRFFPKTEGDRVVGCIVALVRGLVPFRLAEG